MQDLQNSNRVEKIYRSQTKFVIVTIIYYQVDSINTNSFIPSSSIFWESVCFFALNSLCKEACTQIISFSNAPYSTRSKLDF